MTELQPVFGVVFLIVAVWLFVVGIYSAVVAGKATSSDTDPNASLSRGERMGAIAMNVIQILVGVFLGIWGVILLLPADKTSRFGRLTGRSWVTNPGAAPESGYSASDGDYVAAPDTGYAGLRIPRTQASSGSSY